MLINRYLVNFILVNSKAIKKALIKRENIKSNKIFLIPNGIEIKANSKNKSLQKKRLLYEQLSLDPKYSIIICIARMIIYKGHQDLIQAFEVIKKEIPLSLLILVGDGPERKNIKKQVKVHKMSEFVKFLGIRNDINDLIEISDLLVLPSRDNEGSPNVVIEAMERSIPVIATDVGGTSELLNSNPKSGILLPPNHPEKLASAITKLLKTPHLAKQFGENGRNKVIAKFDLNKMIKKYNLIYNSILNN